MDFESNNITHRKPCRSSSLTDLTIMTNEKAIFDCTMMSIPDSFHDNSAALSDLSEQNKILTMQLLSAHQEIENLNTENFRLKTDLQEMIKKINMYKTICSTPIKKNIAPFHKSSTSYHKTKTCYVTFNDMSNESFRDSPNTTTAVVSKETQTDEICNLHPHKLCKRSFNDDNKDLKVGITNNNNNKQLQKPKLKNKICVLNSKRIRGSLLALEDVFSDYFDYCHYLIPNSTTEDIMSNLTQKLENFNLNDYCLLFISERDIKEKNDYEKVIQNIRESLQYTENKSYCEDLTEGKFSFPIIHAIRNPEGDNQVLRILTQTLLSYLIQDIDILRQRTRDLEVKRYCITILERLGSFAYTRETLHGLDEEARREVARLGGNPHLEALLDDLLSWRREMPLEKLDNNV
ncbi:hypothetical protein HF086_012969 [Spodoptera exigua]|uniref:Uncharacterized protein n=1 Tax=Spodoptera exigua TaxID=7107 RepID=A0A922MV85_SPOEX|nr:hypothetical protein HF086_012969 [Spodoptera exigua]